MPAKVGDTGYSSTAEKQAILARSGTTHRIRPDSGLLEELGMELIVHMAKSVGHDRDSRERAVRLTEYLIQLARLRSKTIRDVAEYETVFWLDDIPPQPGCFSRSFVSETDSAERTTWAQIHRPYEPRRPSVPKTCQQWVSTDSSSDPYAEPILLDEVSVTSVDSPQSLTEDDQDFAQSEDIAILTDHPEILAAWQDYLEEKWYPWIEEHKAWKKVHDTYSKVFSILQELQRKGEDYELVLGVGLVRWTTPDGQKINRHMVVADAHLDFEPRENAFSLVENPNGTNLRLELDMLDEETDQLPLGSKGELQELLVGADGDPWDVSVLEQVFRTMAGLMDGEYNKRGIRADGINALTIVPAPALVLRKRSTQGLLKTISSIKEDIERTGLLSKQYADIAEITMTPENGSKELGSERPPEVRSGRLYFPKPTNDEQSRIVDMMHTQDGVLVQGPPGTGKSHTIANLICHMLASGQRILVTAKTPRALKVLEQLLPEEIRPLCVNLLGSGSEERRSLESSVRGILQKGNHWDPTAAELEMNTVASQLQTLKEEKSQLLRRLRVIRESETQSQSVLDGRYRGTAASIAKQVARERPILSG